MNEQQEDVRGVEREVESFFREVREDQRASGDLWERVSERIEVGEASGGGRRGARRWVWAAGIAAALVVGAVVVGLTRGDGSASVSAAEVLEQAVAASVSPESVGIRTLVVEQESEAYFLGDWRGGEPSFEYQVRGWYAAPDRQRIEGAWVIRQANGAAEAGSSAVVWDGGEVWTHNSVEDGVTVYRQDAEGDIFLQSLVMGASLSDLADVLAASCRVPEIIDSGEVLGRSAYVLELSRPRCGIVFPGGDGKLVIWVDQATGFVLRSESYAANGTLSSLSRVTEIEIDAAIADERFEFVSPSGIAVDDRRDRVFGQGVSRMEQPTPISLDEARVEATFTLEEPAKVPAGFALESVQFYWGNDLAKELRSHADWVLLRYVDEEGNWLAISQGYGGLLSGLISAVPLEAVQGTVEVGSFEARWVDGDVTRRWEPGSMLILSWVVAGQRSVALASNVLSLEELVAVAESLE